MKLLLTLLSLVLLFSQVRAEIIPGILNTGMAADGSLLQVGAEDTRWTAPGAILDDYGVHPTVMPDLSGDASPMSPQGPNSQWITGSAGNHGGSSYSMSFDLTGFDPRTVELMMTITTPQFMRIKLNGVVRDDITPTRSRTVSSTHIVTGGFSEGINTIEFQATSLYATDTATGGMGFRGEFLAQGELAKDGFSPKIELQDENVIISWPALEACYQLTTSPDLVSEWTDVPDEAVEAGGRLTVTLPREEERRFFRLRNTIDMNAPPIPVVVMDRPNTERLPNGPVRVDLSPTSEDGGHAETHPILAYIDYQEMDAMDSIDPRRCREGDPPLSFHWSFYFPDTSAHGGEEYASLGIRGYRSNHIYFAPNSMPNLIVEEDQFWRAVLQVTSHVGGIPLTTEVRFRFRYVQSQLSLQMSSICQDPQLDGRGCALKTGLPTMEEH